MAVSFPTELQEKFNESGFSFSIGSTTIRTNVDVGPAKIRRRLTKGVDSTSGNIKLLYSDYAILYNFYDVSLAGGSLPFEYNDPFTGLPAEYRWVSPPTLTPMGGLYFNVSLPWEKMP